MAVIITKDDDNDRLEMRTEKLRTVRGEREREKKERKLIGFLSVTGGAREEEIWRKYDF